MQDLFKDGKARAIGVSNFEQNHIEDIVAMKELLPSINQFEFSPYWHEYDLVKYCNSLKIQVNGYSPLACPDWAPASHKWPKTLLQDATVTSIAKSHKATPAQVILSWEWQQGVVVNPRTYNRDHMMENLQFYNVKLTDDEMKAMSSIDPPSNPKVCPDPHQFK